MLAFGSWACQIIVATTAGYALSVLRPRYAQLLTGLVLATLFVPVVVLLVPLYLEIVHPPLIHHSFIDTYWAVWLPAGASAFNVVAGQAVLRQPAARDLRGGAGRRRGRRSGCSSSIVLPMSRPMLGVVSVFAIMASWKDFLWPLLVLTNPDEQPLSVRLPTIQAQTTLGVFLAALFIASLMPIVGVPDLPALVPARRRARRGGQGLSATASRPRRPRTSWSRVVPLSTWRRG